MRHYDTSCGPMSCVPTRKGWRTRIRHKTLILSCSGVAIPLVKLQVWSFHKWYHYTTAPLHNNIGVYDEFWFGFKFGGVTVLAVQLFNKIVQEDRYSSQVGPPNFFLCKQHK